MFVGLLIVLLPSLNVFVGFLIILLPNLNVFVLYALKHKHVWSHRHQSFSPESPRGCGIYLSVCVITVAKTALSSDSDACSELSARGRSDKEEVLPYIVRVTYRLPQRCHVWTWG